ncbi:TROVE domain-containing protein [Pedobacter heparinus]|uniref:TROVE domain protein n=1 Tax=Pedobacter heparinus (strain ATCC 13125 / DSM 2366 / CIP 104194 / JCM 7457 / NBRC 12017 / NCIMB 9290 / NRRL B-14731 / HIM 762-3) TaxID=485917 RepID=C6XXQ7_PEDHD|nr:TROVE domain-containing protein [Pedobacter heparinus]ACU02311.1 TROVE domain protein [Pedobacter heparinus DSM 2366]
MKFNLLSKTKNQTANHEGAKAFVMMPEMELYSTVVTWSLNDSFYEKFEMRIERLRVLIAQCEPLFVGKLAIYARTKMYMRSVPLVLVTELAKLHSGDNLVARVTDGVIGRADEITELLACYELLNERKGTKRLNRLSKQLQKGLSTAFNRFDEYQFGKYNRDGAIKLRDALFLVHPKAKDELQQLLFNKIVTGDLQTPYTWETELSALGQMNFDSEEAKAMAFRTKWEELIDSGKLGYMALLRNLHNIQKAGISYEHFEKVCARLSDAAEVARAKQFPFRYLAAYRELIDPSATGPVQGLVKKLAALVQGSNKGYTGDLLDALEKAVQASAANIKGFDHETSALIACDVSGSMQTPVSAKSKLLLYDVGLMLAMLLHSRCKNVEVGMFGDTWKTITVPRSNILGNVQEFYRREGEVGYATNGYLVIKDILSRRVRMDKVMLFTDGQLWDSSASGSQIQALWLRYKAEVSPAAKLYLFDLQGYGQAPLQVLRNDVYLIAGWSDKVFEVLAALENGESALDAINKIEL